MSETHAAGKKTRPSLFGTVGKSPSTVQQAEPEIAEKPRAQQENPRAAARGRQDRQDKRQVAGFFSPECAKQLRMLAAEEDTTVQDLLKEALNLMFSAHGKPPIA